MDLHCVTILNLELETLSHGDRGERSVVDWFYHGRRVVIQSARPELIDPNRANIRLSFEPRGW
jgi:hypothetical protein